MQTTHYDSVFIPTGQKNPMLPIFATPPATPFARWARASSLTAVLLLAGCSNERWGFPYRASVQQGNWITSEQVATLQVGMSREQVRFVLGSPTLASVLHANRWDYPYTFQAGTGQPQQRRFTVWFDDADRLAHWQGDPQPDVQPFQQASNRAGDADPAQ